MYIRDNNIFKREDKLVNIARRWVRVVERVRNRFGFRGGYNHVYFIVTMCIYIYI